MYSKRDNLYMNKMTTLELLEFILESIRVIKLRFVGIGNSDDFLTTGAK